MVRRALLAGQPAQADAEAAQEGLCLLDAPPDSGGSLLLRATGFAKADEDLAPQGVAPSPKVPEKGGVGAGGRLEGGMRKCGGPALDGLEHSGEVEAVGSDQELSRPVEGVEQTGEPAMSPRCSSSALSERLIPEARQTTANPCGPRSARPSSFTPKGGMSMGARRRLESFGETAMPRGASTRRLGIRRKRAARKARRSIPMPCGVDVARAQPAAPRGRATTAKAAPIDRPIAR